MPAEDFRLGSAAVGTSSGGFGRTCVPVFVVSSSFGVVDSPVSCHSPGIRKKKKGESILTSPEDSNSSTPISSVPDSMISMD